ncbi:MAG TPA: hypothetical protein VK324_06225 [Tepidisphaeraceae bacterium]|nr:hypothetical protein [Tepidisphaeraceae bacterium]
MPNEYLASDTADAGNTKLQDNILTPSIATGTITTDTTGSANLLSYLQAFYTANPTYAGGSTRSCG